MSQNHSINMAGRYSRHELLKELGPEGQRRIAQTRFLVIGAGGVGCPAALCLAEAGTKLISIVDADAVDMSNLPRQILHTPDRIGMNKALSAKIALQALRPDTEIRAIDCWADESALSKLMSHCDVVLDCSDNFKTRHAANRAAHAAGKPLITVSSIRFSVQIAMFDFSNPESPCYQCTFPEDEETDVKAVSTGVFAPTTGIAGMIAAGEALKWSAGIKSLAGKLLVLDTLHWNMQVISLSKDPACLICAPVNAGAPNRT